MSVVIDYAIDLCRPLGVSVVELDEGAEVTKVNLSKRPTIGSKVAAHSASSTRSTRTYALASRTAYTWARLYPPTN